MRSSSSRSRMDLQVDATAVRAGPVLCSIGETLPSPVPSPAEGHGKKGDREARAPGSHHPHPRRCSRIESACVHRLIPGIDADGAAGEIDERGAAVDARIDRGSATPRSAAGRDRERGRRDEVEGEVISHAITAEQRDSLIAVDEAMTVDVRIERSVAEIHSADTRLAGPVQEEEEACTGKRSPKVLTAVRKDAQ